MAERTIQVRLRLAAEPDWQGFPQFEKRTPELLQEAAAEIDDLRNELRSARFRHEQATTCAGCGQRKHTPLRVDEMGGYVCLTCIDKRLGELLAKEASHG